MPLRSTNLTDKIDSFQYILKDQKAFLTGRSLVQEIQPLDFHEYLIFKNITIKKRDHYLYEKYFEEYIEIGGMPEYVLHKQREYLQSLVDDIIFKEIIAFHNIKKHQVIKDLYLLLMERAGKNLSINKIANILGISPDTAKRFLNMFEDCYLVHLLPRFGKSNEIIL